MKFIISQGGYIGRIIFLIIILTPGKSVSQVPPIQRSAYDLKSIENQIQFVESLAEKKSFDDTAHLQSDHIRLVVANNEAYGEIHAAGYSGISELYINAKDERDLFVPTFAGLNYEHIFSGDSKTFDWDIFEPRIDPIELVRLSDRKVELRQSRTKNWPLKSSISYELIDNSIDFVYSATPMEDIWKKHGYIGIFFASYIDSPKQKGINFIGRSRTGRGDTKPRWVSHLPEAHGISANHRPAGSNWDPSVDSPGFSITLATGFSDLEYVYPFYYGLSGDNVFIMMFENTKDGELRFAQSPNGGGDTNPAWDFVYFRKNYKVGKKFSFGARAVYKKFEGEDDVIKIYEAWSGKKVIRP